ncbi:MAG: nuclear transport factor 2 family protein [Candidatus Binatales bacterium]
MTERFSPDQLMEVVKASPAAVARHDKQSWVALFSRHAVIEDPVGSKPHHNGLHDPRAGVRGSAPLERFFDTFIAPNDISFHVERDVVASPFVVRDVTIELVMKAGLKVHVPMHLLYEICDEDGAPKIAHLRAHWELVPMVRQVLANGWPGVLTMSSLGMRMAVNQGLGAILGFCRGVIGIHRAGKDTVTSFVNAVNEQNPNALAALFDPRNEGISFPGAETILDPAALCRSFDGTLSVSKLISSGYVTSCTCSVRSGDSELRGVGFFEFNSRTRKLHSVRLYCG